MREFVARVGLCETAYELHQKVWSVVRSTIGDGIHFLFREAGGFVKIRHDAGPVGRPCVMPECGKTYDFEVLLNPMVSYQRRKMPVERFDKALEVAKRALEKNGFLVEKISGNFLSGKTLGKPGFKPFKIRTFLAHGKVTVTDQEKAVAAMRNGVGKSKRFGFGMIDLKEVE